MISLRLVCLAAVAAARFLPVLRWPLGCPFKTFVGLPCATCGMTRAWVLEAHGEVRAGFAQSPLGAVLFFAAIAIAIIGWPNLSPRLERRLSWAVAMVVVGNWAYSLWSGVA